MKTRKHILPLAAFAGLALAASSANAAVISVSNYEIASGPGVLDVNTNSTFGDSGSQLTDGIKANPAANVVGWNYNSGSDRPLTTFNLGDVYDLQTIDLWARNLNGTISSVDISVSTDDITYSAITNYTSTWAGINPATDSLDVSALGDAQYVRLTTYSLDWSMLCEVEFDGTVVPEPSASALLGLGGLALLLRRRRR